MHNLTGTILAGGQSSRFGSNKALAQIEGVTFIEKIYNTMKNCSNEILIVSNTDLFSNTNLIFQQNNCHVKVNIIPDIYKYYGPLAGIHAALSSSVNEKVLVCACDYPFLSEELITILIEASLTNKKATAIIPVWNGEIHPLIGIYSKSILANLENYLLKGSKKVLDFILKIQLYCIYIHTVRSKKLSNDKPCGIESSLLNVNTQQEYSIARNIAHSKIR